jgi:sugar phosphate isomerase/epimerase
VLKFSATLAYQHDSVFSPFRANEFDEALKWASAVALDGIELVISDYSSTPPATLYQLKKEIEEYGLEVSTISTGGAYHREGLSLTSREPNVRALAFQRVCQHIDAATILGSNVTLGLLRGIGNQVALEEEKEWLRAALAETDAYATRHGVEILLEAINRYEVKLLNSLAETVEFIESISGIRSTKVLWDLFHANIEDLEFDKEIDRYVGWIGHVHLADNNRAFPGFGKLNFREIVEHLMLSGFDGYASFECLNFPDVETVKARTKEFVQSLRTSVISSRVPA